MYLTRILFFHREILCVGDLASFMPIVVNRGGKLSLNVRAGFFLLFDVNINGRHHFVQLMVMMKHGPTIRLNIHVPNIMIQMVIDAQCGTHSADY